jgi:hypothetical protein
MEKLGVYNKSSCSVLPNKRVNEGGVSTQEAKFQEEIILMTLVKTRSIGVSVPAFF